MYLGLTLHIHHVMHEEDAIFLRSEISQNDGPLKVHLAGMPGAFGEWPQQFGILSL